MKKLKILLILVFGLSTISLTSCGWKPSEEEIKTLEETRSAALAAEKKLAEKKAERQELESKVRAKKAELEKIKADKAAVDNHIEMSQQESAE